MNVGEQIKAYFEGQPESKRGDLLELHRVIQGLMPKCRLWFMDGKDETGKVVSNPSVGYGLRTIRYANGTAKDFYQVGISANTSGLSVYILGIEDRKYLSQTFGRTLGKAGVTGYCIKFKALKDVHIDVLKDAIREGIKHAS